MGFVTALDVFIEINNKKASAVIKFFFTPVRANDLQQLA